MIKSIFLSIITLPSFLQPCNGQHKYVDLQNKNSQSAIYKGHILKQITTTAIPATNANNQINQVVRTVFQDSKGNIWFVGYGGAYRLENLRFINITKNGPW